MSGLPCLFMAFAVFALPACGGDDGATKTIITVTEIATSTEATPTAETEPPADNGNDELPPGRFTFEGAGTTQLEPIEVPEDTTLYWRTSGGLFMLIVLNEREDIVNPQLVVSEASSGETFLRVGYYEFRVTGFADEWAISIK